jgi:hypothetical protein
MVMMVVAVMMPAMAMVVAGVVVMIMRLVGMRRAQLAAPD